MLILMCGDGYDVCVIQILYCFVCDLFGCIWLIVFVGMGGVVCVEFVSVVSVVGGFGFFGMVCELVVLICSEVQ